MNTEETTVLFLNRILNGDLTPPSKEELPGQGDSALARSAKLLGGRAIEASAFMEEIASGNLKAQAPRHNMLLGSSKELQSVLRHLLWTVECVSKGDFQQRVEFLGDFSRYFNLFTEQVARREQAQKERAMLEKQSLEQKNHMLDELLRQQMEHYKSLNEMHKTVRGMRHDMKNHCFALNELLKQGDIPKAQEYLSQMFSQIPVSQDSIYNIGNPVFDALLTDKIGKAKNLGIAVHVQLAMGERELDVANLDWCIILGNALDNAIEACQCLGEEEKQIWIFAWVRKDMFHFSVKNTALAPKPREDGLYETSKNDAGEHGIGLGNVQAAAERYDGVMQTMFEHGVFTLSVMLCGV